MVGQSKPPREIELKLAVPAGSAKAISQHPALRKSRAQQRHEVSTYFDTPDLALAQRGLMLRVRHTGDQYVQTLKADAHHGAVADRAEWEWKLTDNAPNLALLETTPVAEVLPPRQEVEPVFITEVDRTIRTLTLDDGTVAEAAWDEGAIVAGKRRQPISELELELKDGDPAALLRFAVKLHEDVSFTIASESKAARGYRLRSDEPPDARKADAVVLRKQTGATEALRHIVTTGLGHLVMNQPAGLAGDAEGVHQMRVAVRRLRAALMLFKPHLEPLATARFEAALRHSGRIFGEARDWDVFCLQILPEVRGVAGAAGWSDLLEHPALERRRAAHRDFAEELRRPPLTALVLGLAAWAEQARTTPGLIGDDELQRPIEDLCPQLLDRLARKVDKRGRHIDRSDTDRHALRKSLKKLRYAIDYVQSLYPHKVVKPYLRACKKLQQALGDINDTVAATALAQSLADETRPDLAPAIGALANSLDRRHAKALQDLPKQWKTFAAEEKFWRQ
jgi:inorganic triphosphatase YgiF